MQQAAPMKFEQNYQVESLLQRLVDPHLGSVELLFALNSLRLRQFRLLSES
jgi:hypothetical protein